jgi:sortase B
MKNGTMFAALHKYENNDFFKANRNIIMYTPERILTYEIFASVVYSDKLIPDSYDFQTAEGRQAFLDSLFSSRDMRNQFLEGVNVSSENRIITLSTCIGSEPTKRYLLVGVLSQAQPEFP